MPPLHRATASTAVAVSLMPPLLPRSRQSMHCSLSGSPLQGHKWHAWGQRVLLAAAEAPAGEGGSQHSRLHVQRLASTGCS